MHINDVAETTIVNASDGQQKVDSLKLNTKKMLSKLIKQKQKQWLS